MACFQRNLFDKTVFHEFVAQAQNERRWKKERGSCSVACFASLTVNKPSQKFKKKNTHRSLASYWKVAIHFASVRHDRWIQQILRWMPDGRHTAGCPRHNWATKLSAFVRFLQIDEWQILAQDTALWLHLTDYFIHFCRH